jgi:hypothetical protein
VDPVPRACLTHLGAGPGGGDAAGAGTKDAAGAGNGAEAGSGGGPGEVRDDWVVLHAPVAGVYRIAAPYKLPRGTACPTPAD